MVVEYFKKQNQLKTKVNEIKFYVYIRIYFFKKHSLLLWLVAGSKVLHMEGNQM